MNPVNSTRPRRWPPALMAAGVVAVYLGAVVATSHWRPHGARPLFDGVLPSQPYEWMNPPPEFAATNTKPKPVVRSLSLAGGRSKPEVVATDDSQFVVNLSAGSFVAHGADTAVRAVVTPLDPAKLGAVGPGLEANGNGYRLEFSFTPSGQAIPVAAVTGDVIITAPHPATGLLYSPDGTSWTKLSTQAVGGPTTVGASFTKAGVYLAVGSPAGAAAPRRGGGFGTVAVGVGVAGLAMAIAALALLVGRRRQRRDKRRGPPSRMRGARPPAKSGDRRPKARGQRRPPRKGRR